MGIRSRRDVLQTLFYSTRNSAAETGPLFAHLQTLQTQYPDGAFSMRGDDIMPRYVVYNELRAAEATAQDGAFAFILILDYALRRLGRSLTPDDQRALGPEFRGVRLNRAIWALANQARHADEWIAMTPEALAVDRDARGSVEVIRALRYDPQNLNAAREFVCALPVPTYFAFEQWLLTTAHEALVGTGWHLGMVTAGTYRLDPDEAAAPAPA